VTSSPEGKQVKTAEPRKVVQYENLPPKKYSIHQEAKAMQKR